MCSLLFRSVLLILIVFLPLALLSSLVSLIFSSLLSLVTKHSKHKNHLFRSSLRTKAILNWNLKQHRSLSNFLQGPATITPLNTSTNHATTSSSPYTLPPPTTISITLTITLKGTITSLNTNSKSTQITSTAIPIITSITTSTLMIC